MDRLVQVVTPLCNAPYKLIHKRLNRIDWVIHPPKRGAFVEDILLPAPADGLGIDVLYFDCQIKLFPYCNYSFHFKTRLPPYLQSYHPNEVKQVIWRFDTILLFNDVSYHLIYWLVIQYLYVVPCIYKVAVFVAKLLLCEVGGYFLRHEAFIRLSLPIHGEHLFVWYNKRCVGEHYITTIKALLDEPIRITAIWFNLIKLLHCIHEEVYHTLPFTLFWWSLPVFLEKLVSSVD